MNRRVVACWILFVAFGGVLSAQRGFPPVDIMGVEPLEFGEVVRGAPFSAEATTEMTQELRDGNRIEQRSTVIIARDGTGRTRREQSLPPIGPVIPDPDVRMITISDPRQRTLYLIDPQRQDRFQVNGARRAHRARLAIAAAAAGLCRHRRRCPRKLSGTGRFSACAPKGRARR